MEIINYPNGARGNRGRPYAAVNGAEIVRLRDEVGLSWRAIGKRLNADVRTTRRVYSRTLNTSKCGEICSTPWHNSATAIPANGHGEDLLPRGVEDPIHEFAAG
jgi:hypothetical protein